MLTCAGWVCVTCFSAFVVGVCCGRYTAERAAVIRADGVTAHYMQGRFFYIVPEHEYVEMVQKAHRVDYEDRDVGKCGYGVDDE